MKITLITGKFPPEHTTVGSIVLTTGKALKALGHDVSIITTTRERQVAGLSEYEGLSVFRIYADYNERYRAHRSMYNPQTVPELKKIINKLKPEIVHCHNISFYISYHVLRIAKDNGAKIFFTAHDCMLFHYGKFGEFINPNDLSVPDKFNYKISFWPLIKKFRFRYNPIRNTLIRFYLKYVDRMFAVSGALKDAILQNGIKKDIEIFHNGIDSVDWLIGEDDLKKFRLKNNLIGKKVVLFGGRLSPGKGGRQAVLAMVKVAKIIPNAVLLIMGSKNNFTEEMIKLASDLGITDRLVFTGWLSGEELRVAYHASDVVVVPSVAFDSFPTVNLEAGACHKPVIATCFGGSREIVEDGKTGFIVNPYDIDSLADKIIDLLSNPEKAAALGEAGFARIKENFSLENHIKKLLEWYSR